MAGVPTEARVAAGAARGVRRRTNRSPAVAALAAVAVVVVVQLARNKEKLSSGQKAAALGSVVVLILTVGLVSEFSPELALGFSLLLMVSVLLGGTDVATYLFVTIPRNLAASR